MSPLNPHVLGPILEVLPAAIAFSAQLLLAEKSSVIVASALFAGRTEVLPPTGETMTPIQQYVPNPGWSHFGIND